MSELLLMRAVERSRVAAMAAIVPFCLQIVVALALQKHDFSRLDPLDGTGFLVAIPATVGVFLLLVALRSRRLLLASLYLPLMWVALVVCRDQVTFRIVIRLFPVHDL